MQKIIIFQLKSVSPIVFSLAKEGDKVLLRRNKPKPNEYRDKIGPAVETILVFKGRTKIGMIPVDASDFNILKLNFHAKICEMSEEREVVKIKFNSV